MQVDNNMWNSLHGSIRYSRFNQAKVMIDRFNVQELNEMVTNTGFSLLTMAIEQGNPEVTKILLDKGVDIDEKALVFVKRIQNAEITKLVSENLEDRAAKKGTPNSKTTLRVDRDGEVLDPDYISFDFDSTNQTSKLVNPLLNKSDNPEKAH